MPVVPYFVYIVKCTDGTLYVGITTDVERRIEEHNGSDKGAKYTRFRRPVTLFYVERCENRAVATRREAALKGLSRAQKLQLISP